ncbi:MAG: extracellular solute-binding protein [Micromonosporaceae bacterium]|nr:extracellular solute-binding protein [Micromonosporaceae bacterium]
MRVLTRGRRVVVAVISAAALVGVAACSDDGDEPGEDADITLVIDIFGEQGFGYDELYAQFETDHPNITIEERGGGLGLGDYNERLVQQITAGAGAGDVVALEEGTIVQFYAQTDRFVNLADHGASDLQGNFLPWKWEQGAPGGFVLGLGTDVGSMALCYRNDVLEAAGLPTDRAELAGMWPTWEDFIAVGEQFVAAGIEQKFVDAATNFYNTVLMQVAGNGTGYTYYDIENNLALDNPDIRTAWDLTIRMIEADLSANLNSFSDEWNAGFQSGSFATIGCPAWMTGVISGAAGDDNAGNWNLTDAPGEGGNWGGSFLAVTAESEHPAEAAELVTFLTGPDGQTAAFEALGNLPSSPQALAGPEVQQASNAYFSDAPTGQIFGAGAADFQPVYLGPQNNAVRTEFENALRSVEQGERTPDQAWQDAQDNAAAIG